MTSLGFPGAKTGEPGEWGIFFSHPPNEKPWFLYVFIWVFAHKWNNFFGRRSTFGGWDYHQELGDSIPTTICAIWVQRKCCHQHVMYLESSLLQVDKVGAVWYSNPERDRMWNLTHFLGANHIKIITLQSKKHRKTGKTPWFLVTKGSHQPCSLPCGRHLGHFGFDDFDDFGCGWQREAAPAGPGAPWSGSEGLVQGKN